MVSLILCSSLVSTPRFLPSSTAKHLPHVIWEVKGQINMQNGALRDSRKKSVNPGNWEFEAKHRGLQCCSQNQPITQWTNNQGLNVTREGPGFTRTPAPPSANSNKNHLCFPSTVGTVFLEWAWAEEAQSHLPVGKWMTIPSPQRRVMSVRSTATPNGAGSGEAQMKQMPPTLR